MLYRCSIFTKIVLFICVLFFTVPVFAQQIDYTRGSIVEVGEKNILDPDNNIFSQMVLVKDRKGVLYQAESQIGEVSVGDRVVMTATHRIEYDESLNGIQYDIYGRDRTIPLAILAGVFFLAVLSLGFKQGLRALSALAGTLFVIFGIYTPMLLGGYSPIITSCILGILIAGCAVFISHGYKRSTIIAYISTLLSVVFALLIATIAIYASGLTGVVSDEVTYLSSSIGVQLDFMGIMIGGVIIAMLGVLDDISITQVAVVEELKKSKPDASNSYLYKSALRVGRDHAGALVNTLVLVYVGTSLPIVLLLQSLQSNFLITIFQEQFAFEIIRSLSGSIGLIACVPIATYLSVRFLHVHSKDTPVEGCPHCTLKHK